MLKDGDVAVWDSLAICEYLAEKFPAARLWPADATARALGRAAAAEMHSGFPSLRGECPMDLSLRAEVEVSEATHADLRRLVELWSAAAEALRRPVPGRRLVDRRRLLHAGGDAPPQLRPARSPTTATPAPCGAYAERLLETPEFLEWEQAALADVRPN